MPTASGRQYARLYVSGRIVVLVEGLSFVIKVSEFHSRDDGVHGPRRHGRLKERRTDLGVGWKLGGLAVVVWRGAKWLIMPGASDDDTVEFQSS